MAPDSGEERFKLDILFKGKILGQIIGGPSSAAYLFCITAPIQPPQQPGLIC